MAQISKFVRQLCNFHSLQVIIGEFFFGQNDVWTYKVRQQVDLKVVY